MLSSDEEIFNNAIGPYKEALLKSGYDIDEGSGNELKFTLNTKKRKRKSRPTVWFNPPFSLSVKTNIGGQKKSCLNIRSEILRKCPHIRKFTLGMVKP